MSREENLIDFPVSDLWRDHYAAQGLTFASGRSDRAQAKSVRLEAIPDEGTGTLKDLLALLREQEAKIQTLTSELARVKREQNREDSRASFEGVE